MGYNLQGCKESDTTESTSHTALLCVTVTTLQHNHYPGKQSQREDGCVETDRIRGSPAKDSHVPVTRESSGKQELVERACGER